jgi:hypothetical protein
MWKESNMKKLPFPVVILFLVCFSIFGESEKPLSVGVKPYGSVPLGSSSELFKIGGGISVSGFYLPELFRIAGITLESNYFAIPMENSNACLLLQEFSFLNGNQDESE